MKDGMWVEAILSNEQQNGKRVACVRTTIACGLCDGVGGIRCAGGYDTGGLAPIVTSANNFTSQKKNVNSVTKNGNSVAECVWVFPLPFPSPFLRM